MFGVKGLTRSEECLLQHNNPFHMIVEGGDRSSYCSSFSTDTTGIMILSVNRFWINLRFTVKTQHFLCIAVFGSAFVQPVFLMVWNVFLDSAELLNGEAYDASTLRYYNRHRSPEFNLHHSTRHSDDVGRQLNKAYLHPDIERPMSYPTCHIPIRCVFDVFQRFFLLRILVSSCRCKCNDL